MTGCASDDKSSPLPPSAGAVLRIDPTGAVGAPRAHPRGFRAMRFSSSSSQARIADRWWRTYRPSRTCGRRFGARLR